MHTREHMEQMIWDYIDGLSTPEEKAMVEQLLHADARWKNVYDELLEVNAQIHASDWTEQPSMRFTPDVMDEVSKYKVARPARAYINKKIIYGIAAFFGITMILVLVFGLSQIDFSGGAGQNTYGIDLKKWTIDTSSFLNSTVLNIFMFFNVVAGLMLLDKYLKKSKVKSQEN